MAEPQLFFVYGTLRRGDDNDITLLKPAPRFLGRARIQGTMYHLGAFPGVILGKESGRGNQVIGEVYDVSPELEKVLDEIEAQYPSAPDYYFKRSITLTLEESGEARQAFVYEINPAYVIGKPVIESGDWVKDR